jgi:hypothetical protein
MDFGFYKVDAIRGFNCFLVIVEARTANYWTYICRSKHPPIKLCLWFIHLACKVLGFAVAVICTDGGGELWGSSAFCTRLFEEAQVIVEPPVAKIRPQKAKLNKLSAFSAFKHNSCSMQQVWNPFSGALPYSTLLC